MCIHACMRVYRYISVSMHTYTMCVQLYMPVYMRVCMCTCYIPYMCRNMHAVDKHAQLTHAGVLIMWPPGTSAPYSLKTHFHPHIHTHTHAHTHTQQVQTRLKASWRSSPGPAEAAYPRRPLLPTPSAPLPPPLGPDLCRQLLAAASLVPRVLLLVGQQATVQVCVCVCV